MYAQLEGIVPKGTKTEARIGLKFEKEVAQGTTATLLKYGGYVNGMRHPKGDLTAIAKSVCEDAQQLGFDALLQEQEVAWARSLENGGY